MPEGAVYVGRPSRWGNRWHVWHGRDQVSAVALFRAELLNWTPDGLAKWLAPLRGRALACWCPLDQPCHADVLLELANA
jgi:hypothetical protein